MKSNIFCKRLMVAVGLSFYTLWGQAQDHFNKIEIATIKNARTNEELNERLQAIEALRVKQGACEIQLKAERLPYACFELQSSSVNSTELSSECVRIARATKEIALYYPNKLPADCIKTAKIRIQVNRYKLGKVLE